MKMKNILITGGAGFIGSNLALDLISKGYNITVLDNLSEQIHGNDPANSSPLYQSIIQKVFFIKGCVTSREDWIESIKNQDVIIHLAAETGTGQSMYEIERYVNVNIGGTSLLLDVLSNENHKIKKVIVASSRAIYGEGKYECKTHGVIYPDLRLDENMTKGDFNCKCPICKQDVTLLSTSEDSKIHPTSVYGITKQNQEQLVHTVCRSIGIESVAFRYQNVYGPGQSLSNPYTGILSIFSTLIRNNKGINIFEDGEESRDFVYIDDVVDATIAGLEKEIAKYQTYNVGSDIPISVIEVAKTLKSYYKSDISITISGNYRTGDIRHNYADLSKIKEDLDYEPKYSFTKGIEKFCNWVTTQEVSVDNYDKSLKELIDKKIFK